MKPITLLALTIVLAAAPALAEPVERVIPGQGLTGSNTHGPNVRLNVGAGPGIAVSRDKVAVRFAGVSCAPGSYLTGFAADGSPVCTPFPPTPPHMPDVPDMTVPVGAPVEFTVIAYDLNGDPLTYAADSLPSGATFSPVTRTFSWTPQEFQIGVHPVIFTVTDGLYTFSQNNVITVEP
jgi:hypothetical protein